MDIFATWQVGEVVLTMLWFFLFIIWIWLLISVFADIFRSDDLGGGGKTLWIIFVILLPYLGVFIYLLARGHKMGERALRNAEAQEAAARAYIRDAAAASASPSEEIARLADLKQKGLIDDAEYQRLKAKVVG